MVRRDEIIAVTAVLITIIGVPLFIGWFQDNHIIGQYEREAKVFTLTGVARYGIWTIDKVNGHNYWWRKFEPATIHLEAGDDVVLRLQSADVTHEFYSPSLGIGPVAVEPGHTEIVRFKADEPGAHKYFCIAICGECHFYMQGWILVGPDAEIPEPDDVKGCGHDLPEPPPGDMVRHGEYLYETRGCVTCHGVGGAGGVKNFNYSSETIPAHDNLAEKMFLEEEEEAEAFINLLTSRVDLENIEEIPEDISRYKLTLIQYKNARELIRNGKHCAKLDENGPEPPLQMPSWKEWLTDYDIDSIIAYLLTLYEWEEYE